MSMAGRALATASQPEAKPTKRRQSSSPSIIMLKGALPPAAHQFSTALVRSIFTVPKPEFMLSDPMQRLNTDG
jgi:hypothetical protein